MKNFFKFMLVGAVALGGLKILTLQAADKLLPVPTVGKSYTVEQLKTLINTNNPAGTSTFLVALNGKGIVSDSNPPTSVTQSKSTTAAGLDHLIKTAILPGQGATKKTTVTLQQDKTLIATLENNKLFDSSTTKDKYAKILLYFTLQDPSTKQFYRFYLNDPNPAGVVFRGNVKTSGAAEIIKKWDVR